MPKIDFYILSVSTQIEAWRYLAQYLEKLYQEQKNVYVYLDDKHEISKLDAFLWTYRDDAYLPHHAFYEALNSPIVLGCGNELPHAKTEFVVNLGKSLPPDYQKINRLIEIVYQSEAVLESARKRFRVYRDANVEIQTIKL